MGHDWSSVTGYVSSIFWDRTCSSIWQFNIFHLDWNTRSCRICCWRCLNFRNPSSRRTQRTWGSDLNRNHEILLEYCTRWKVLSSSSSTRWMSRNNSSWDWNSRHWGWSSWKLIRSSWSSSRSNWRFRPTNTTFRRKMVCNWNASWRWTIQKRREGNNQSRMIRWRALYDRLTIQKRLAKSN